MKAIKKNSTAMLAAVVSIAMSANSAQADHNKVLRELDESAFVIERLADRADRDIRYYFRTAPQAKCLREQFCLIEEKAEDLQKGLRRRCPDFSDMEECLLEMDQAFVQVQRWIAELRKWQLSCRPVATLSFGSGNFCATTTRGRGMDLYLQRLCARVDEMGKQINCMLERVEDIVDGSRPRRPIVQQVQPPRIQLPPTRAQQNVQPILPSASPTRHRPALGQPLDRGGVRVPILKHKNNRLYISFSF